MGGEVIEVQPEGGPTVLRILLGSQLRRLREIKGITREEAGYAIRASGSKISRMELGRVSFKERDVTDLLEPVRRHEDERDAGGLAIKANSPGWWHKYGDVLPDWFQVYVGLEEAASLIRLMRCSSCPGCSRRRTTPARWCGSGRPGAATEEIERRISLRMGTAGAARTGRAPAVGHRGRGGAAPPHRRQGGDAGAARATDSATEEPKVTLQVMPFRAAAMPPRPVPFTILRFPEPDLPDVVYLEQLTSALYLDKRDDVESTPR